MKREKMLYNKCVKFQEKLIELDHENMRLKDEKMKWISVKDRLPVFPCILFWDDKRITVIESEYLTDEKSIQYMVNGNPDFRVTHWMNLPEPPEEI